MIKILFKKIKKLRLYFVSDIYIKPEQSGLNKLKERKNGYGIIWTDEP